MGLPKADAFVVVFIVAYPVVPKLGTEDEVDNRLILAFQIVSKDFVFLLLSFSAAKVRPMRNFFECLG